MFKGFKYEGYWWLPDNPERTIAGILEFEPVGRTRLRLFGTFQDIENHIGGKFEPQFIHGLTLKGEPITLERCMRVSATFGTGYPVSVFSAERIIEGYHFNDENEIVFKRIFTSFSQLEDWLGIKTFGKKFEFSGTEITRAEFEYLRKDPIRVQVDDSVNISIHVRGSFPMGDYHASMEQVAEIEITSENPRRMEEFWEYIFTVSNFLCLGITEPITPKYVVAYFAEPRSQAVLGIPVDKVNYYWTMPDIKDPEKKVFPDDMLFNYSNISEGFAEYLRTWFHKAKDLNPIRRIYFDLLYNRRINLVLRLLYLVNAVEAYHKLRFGGKYLEPDEFDVLYSDLIDVVRKKYKGDFLKRAERYLELLNEYNLRNRLKDILNTYESIIGIQIGNITSFIHDVVITRHFYTHYVREYEENAKRGVELFVLCSNLSFIIEICLLSEMGLPAEKINELVKGDHRFDFIRNPRIFD